MAAAEVKPGSAGFSYHRRLDAAILVHRRDLGHVEIMADHFLRAPRESWAILRRLKTFLPVTAHGIGLSLGSAEGLDPDYLEKVWDFLDFLKPAYFSEHLAFTRAGGKVLPHFAPLPRDASALRALSRNAALLRSGMACPFLVENPAFPIEVPGGWGEGEFLTRAADAAGADILLDLHNLHANAVNRGFDAFAELERLPAGRVREVHLAGGYKGKRWLIDSHTRPAPDEVYALLTRVRELGADPLVTLEWDDGFPAMEEIVAQLRRARGPAASVPAFAPAFAPVGGGLDLADYQDRFVAAMQNGAVAPVAGIPVRDLSDYAAGLSRKALKSLPAA